MIYQVKYKTFTNSSLSDLWRLSLFNGIVNWTFLVVGCQWDETRHLETSQCNYCFLVWYHFFSILQHVIDLIIHYSSLKIGMPQLVTAQSFSHSCFSWWFRQCQFPTSIHLLYARTVRWSHLTQCVTLPFNLHTVGFVLHCLCRDWKRWVCGMIWCFFCLFVCFPFLNVYWTVSGSVVITLL